VLQVRKRCVLLGFLWDFKVRLACEDVVARMHPVGWVGATCGLLCWFLSPSSICATSPRACPFGVLSAFSKDASRLFLIGAAPAFFSREFESICLAQTRAPAIEPPLSPLNTYTLTKRTHPRTSKKVQEKKHSGGFTYIHTYRQTHYYYCYY